MDFVPHLGTVGEVDGPPDRNGCETFPFISEPHPHRYYALCRWRNRFKVMLPKIFQVMRVGMDSSRSWVGKPWKNCYVQGKKKPVSPNNRSLFLLTTV